MSIEKLVTPDFLIVGAMKAGTSTLVDLLNQHPNITIPQDELYYFSNSKNYMKGDDWYSQQLLKNINTSKKIIGEKCASYSFIEKSASRIYRYKKNMKFIWILRNPVTRTYSNYLHNFCNGLDSLSFEEALENETSRVKENIFWGYKHRSNYLAQIKNYLNNFDQSQFLFLDFADLKLNQNHLANNILQFLGESSYNFKSIHSNKTKVTVFPKLISFSISKFGYSSIPHKALRRIEYPISIKSFPEMGHLFRMQLVEYFHEHNENLSRLISLNCNKWNTSM